MILERHLKSYLTRRCKELDIYHRKFTSPGYAGVPDWILINNSKVLFLELKAPGKKCTVLQEKEIARLVSSGAYAGYTDSYAGIEFFLSYLIER